MGKRNNTGVYLIVLLICTVIFAMVTIYASSSTKKQPSPISAKAATLYEAETNTFLYEKNADQHLPMASTTKIMTALIALENCESDDVVAIDPHAIGTEGSSAYLKMGDRLTMEELLYALLLQSANDAAVAIAYHIGGDVQGFADMMNQKAAELGLENTSFSNPHGLDEENHYTTARDLALLASYALKNETFKKICSTYKKKFVTEERERTYVNHNKLLNKYSGCIGVKTGFTKKSGRCLVGAAEKDGLTFVSVTLDAPNDWSDHERLFDIGFDTLEKINLAEIGEFCYKLPVIGGSAEAITVENDECASIIVEKGTNNTIYTVKLSKFAVAPIKEGDILGEVFFIQDGYTVASVKLKAANDVEKEEKKTFFSRLFSKS